MAQVALDTENSTNGPEPIRPSVEGVGQDIIDASLDSDFRHPKTLDLSAHSTPSSQVDVPDDNETVDSVGISKDAYEEKEADVYWKTVSAFASDITTAAKNALLTRRRGFTRVVAVIAYWMTARNLAHLRTEADNLGRLFEDEFNFEVLIYKIPDSVKTFEFISTIANELNKVIEDRDSLFILYYGGHASIDNSNDVRLWQKDNIAGSPQITWSAAIQALFETNAFCFKLFIFDCCHAGGMIDSTVRWETSCELLGACDADVKASALKISSFTKAVLQEISNTAYNVWELHTALCSTAKKRHYSLEKYPHYRNFVSRQSGAGSALLEKVRSFGEYEDRPQEPSDMLTRMRNMSDAVMCVAVTFNCDAKSFMEEIEEIKNHWRRWFRSAPSESEMIIVRACQGPKLLAAFDSNSCITIWSFPIWHWDAMAPSSGYQRIGIMRPQNHVLTACGTQDDFAEPDCSSDIIPGEAMLSLRPSTTNKLSSIQEPILEGTTGDGLSNPGSIRLPSITSTEGSATPEPLMRNYPREQLLERDTADTQDDSAVPDNLSNSIAGEAELLSQPSTPDKVCRIQETILEGTTGEDLSNPRPITQPCVTSTEGSATPVLLARNCLREQALEYDTADIQDDATGPDHPSNIITGEAGLLSQPSTPNNVSGIQEEISEERPQENTGSIERRYSISGSGGGRPGVLVRTYSRQQQLDSETVSRGVWRETSTLHDWEQDWLSSDSEQSNSSSLPLSPVSASRSAPIADGSERAESRPNSPISV